LTLIRKCDYLRIFARIGWGYTGGGDK
jgi:hypothetical protein